MNTQNICLIKLRLDAGITVNDLAYELGLPIEYVRWVENGQREFPMERVSEWADCIRVTPQHLIVVLVNSYARRICLKSQTPLFFSLNPISFEEAKRNRSLEQQELLK